MTGSGACFGIVQLVDDPSIAAGISRANVRMPHEVMLHEVNRVLLPPLHSAAEWQSRTDYLQANSPIHTRTHVHMAWMDGDGRWQLVFAVPTKLRASIQVQHGSLSGLDPQVRRVLPVCKCARMCACVRVCVRACVRTCVHALVGGTVHDICGSSAGQLHVRRCDSLPSRAHRSVCFAPLENSERPTPPLLFDNPFGIPFDNCLVVSLTTSLACL